MIGDVDLHLDHWTVSRFGEGVLKPDGVFAIGFQSISQENQMEVRKGRIFIRNTFTLGMSFRRMVSAHAGNRIRTT